MTRQASDHAPERGLNALLAAYAAGTLSEPLHALVGSHLEIRPDSRPFVAALESAAAQALEQGEARPLRDREARLGAIFGSEADGMPAPGRAEDAAGGPPPAGAARRSATSDGDNILPRPLRAYLARGDLGTELADLRWRTRLPGIRECRVAGDEHGEATFYWIRAGRRLPSHTHEGSEVTLVLRGCFADAFGHYRRGDIAIADSDIDHRPMAGSEDDCICFAVTDAPLRLTGPFARFVLRLMGR